MIGPVATPYLLQVARELGCQSAIIDGEAIVQDEQGRSEEKFTQNGVRAHHSGQKDLMT